MTKPIPGTDIFVVNNQPTEQILIIASHYVKCIAWCKKHRINPRSPRVKFVWKREQLDGYSNIWFVDLWPGLMSTEIRETRGFKEIPG